MVIAGYPEKQFYPAIAPFVAPPPVYTQSWASAAADHFSAL